MTLLPACSNQDENNSQIDVLLYQQQTVSPTNSVLLVTAALYSKVQTRNPPLLRGDQTFVDYRFGTHAYYLPSQLAIRYDCVCPTRLKLYKGPNILYTCDSYFGFIIAETTPNPLLDENMWISVKDNKCISLAESTIARSSSRAFRAHSVHKDKIQLKSCCERLNIPTVSLLPSGVTLLVSPR
jgi:hypothetical protein